MPALPARACLLHRPRPSDHRRSGSPNGDARSGDEAAPPASPPSGDSQAAAPPAPPASPDEPRAAGRRHRRPAGLIIACALLGLLAIGSGIWALQSKSEADDAQAALEKTERDPAPTSTSTEDAELQADFAEIEEEIGATNESVEDMQRQLADAEKQLEEATTDREEADDALTAAKAETETFKANAERARACLSGAVEAVGAAVESGGAEAAVAQLEQLAGSCRSAASS